MELTVKLQVFEGPLDLLLYLLEKNKVNIYDIPIVESISILEKAVLSTINVHFWTVRRLRWRMVCG